MPSAVCAGQRHRRSEGTYTCTLIPFQFNNPGTGLGGPAVGDFFRTGKLSLAVTTGVGTVSVLQGNGDGTFQAPVNFITGFHGTQPAGLVAGDFNGDGKLDLATANAVSGDISVLLNTTPPVGVTAPIATATSLAADTSTSVFGQPVTLTATVTSSGGAPTGTVTFFDGTTVLGRVAVDPNGQAILTLAPGVGVRHALPDVLRDLLIEVKAEFLVEPVLESAVFTSA